MHCDFFKLKAFLNIHITSTTNTTNLKTRFHLHKAPEMLSVKVNGGVLF
jgi:hypothetical protein